VLSIAPGYDPRYLTRQVGAGAENYYLSAVAEHGEPPGHWWGPGADELGLGDGAEVDAPVMEELYSTFFDPRDPNFLRKDIPDEEKARLGRKPPKYDNAAEKAFQAKLAAEPDADPERQKELLREAKGSVSQAVMHHDATFSPTKSVTLLHAGLQAAAVKAKAEGRLTDAATYEQAAEKVWNAVDAGAAASLHYLQEHAATARRGSHSQVIDGRSTGKWIDAGSWVVARFRQHTNREGEPHLHVHQAILNRQKGSDGRWSGLSGKAIYRARPAAAAYGERVMHEQLQRDLGVELRARPDGNGYEVVGVTPEQIAAFSTRRTQVTDYVKERVEDYIAAHGRPPSARAIFRMAQDGGRRTKKDKLKLKDAPSRQEELAAWEKKTTEHEIGLLSQIPGRALGRLTGKTAEKARQRLANLDYDQVLRAAIADAQASTATFSRYELIRHINRHLPEYLGGLPGERIEAILEELADAALDPAGPSAVRKLNAPDVVYIPPSLQRADGTSVYQAPRWERYTTAAMLDTESELITSATGTGAPGLHPETALEALRARCSPQTWESIATQASGNTDRSETEQAEQTGAGREAAPASATPAGPAADGPTAAPADGPAPGFEGSEAAPAPVERTLLDDQAEAVYGILTSGRRVDALVGPAGTGKTFTVEKLAQVWREQTGAPVVGLTTAQNAAYVLAGEGMDDAWNIARWLKAIDTGKVRLTRGQLIVVDEAGMVPTDDLARIEALAEAAGAKVVWSGDPSQLSAPQAGGAMRHLVETAGAYELTSVKRFTDDWEGPASLQLRTGTKSVLDEYDAHGRLQDGDREDMETAAQQAYLSDYLDGRQSLLLAPTNEKAAELAGRVRAKLVELDKVAQDGVELRDSNTAGRGDLIVARENNQQVLIGDTARQLSNRDVLRVATTLSDGTIVANLIDKNGRPTEHAVELEPGYVKNNVELAYAGTVHSAQGRTVHRSYSLVDDSVTRNMFYVMLTRGADGNYAYVVRDSDRVADLRPGPEQAAERTAAMLGEARPLDGEAAPAPVEQRDQWAVLHGVLDRAEDSETAVEAMKAEAQRPTHMAHLGGMLFGELHDNIADGYINGAQARGALTASQAAALRDDEAKDTLGRLLRQIEMSGRDASRILDIAVDERELDTAESLAKTLHWRIKQAAEERGINVDTLEPSEDQIEATWKGRTPVIGDPDTDHMLGDTSLQMDVRTHTLGQEALERPPTWLADHLGQPPAEDVVERGMWAERAGRVLAFRELVGIVDEAAPLGPEPSRRTPEIRAAFMNAHDALTGARPGQVSQATAGELWSTRARYERELAWAPPYVADELRTVSIEARERAGEAVRLRAQAAAAADENERAVLTNRARGQEALADALQQRQAVLEDVHAARNDWHENTRQARIDAMRADAQLRLRDDVDEDLLPRLHSPGELDVAHELEATDRERTAAAEQQIPGQLTLDGWDEPAAEPTPTRAAEPAPGVDPAEVLYERYAMRRSVGGTLNAATVAEELDISLGEAVEYTERWSARYERAAEPETIERQAEPDAPAPEVEAADPSREPVGEQLTLDVFDGEPAPAAAAADPELSTALEKARVARQIVQGREAEQAAERAAEEERVRREATRSGPERAADIERHQEKTADVRRKLEGREATRAAEVSDEASEAARLTREEFPAAPRPGRGPRREPPSAAPRRKPRGPSRGGPSLGR
jgi:hypothetical protein